MLNFTIKFLCLDKNNNVIYKWHTNEFKSIKVLSIINNEPQFIEKLPDALETIKGDLIRALPPGPKGDTPVKGVDYFTPEELSAFVGKKTDDGGEVFSDYDTNIAIGDYSTAFGKNTISGCKGYYIQSIDTENSKIYLSSSQQVPVLSTANNTVSAFVTPAYSVGDYFCLINDSHYVYKATIESIQNNVVTYNGDLGIDKISGTCKDPHDFSFFVPTKPLVGVATLTTRTFALGYKSICAGRDGFAAGNSCVVAANGGFALGSQCVAGYVGFSFGYANKALGNYSAAFGSGNEALANYSFTSGGGNKTKSNYQFVAGYGNTASDARSCQTVLGMYSDPTPEKINDKAFILGWGSSSKGKNIFTVDLNGKAVFAGDVVANGESLATANSNANTAKTNASSALTKATNAENKVTKLEEYSGIIDVPYLDKVATPIDRTIYRAPYRYLALDGKFYDYAAIYTVEDYTQFKTPIVTTVKDSQGNDKTQYNACYDVNNNQYYVWYNNTYYPLDSGTIGNQVFNGRTYVGEVIDPENAQNGTYGVFKVYELYMHVDSVGWVRLKTDKTKGYFAERFNSPDNKPTGSFSSTFGVRTEASAYAALAGGDGSKAKGSESVAIGAECIAEEYAGAAIGNHVISRGQSQFARGKYNEPLGNDYLDIVGNGTSIGARSNAYTLDKKGNAWFAGSVEATHMILKSPNGTRFKITVDDDGSLSSEAIQE